MRLAIVLLSGMAFCGLLAGCDQARDPSRFASFEQAQELDKKSKARIAVAWGEASKDVGKLTYRSKVADLDALRLKLVSLQERIKDIPANGEFDSLRIEGLQQEVDRIDAAKRYQKARALVEGIGRTSLNDPQASFEEVVLSEDTLTRDSDQNKAIFAEANAAKREYDQAANKLQETLLKILEIPLPAAGADGKAPEAPPTGAPANPNG